MGKTMKVLSLLAILLIAVALVLAPATLSPMEGLNSSYAIFMTVTAILLAAGLTLRQI